jgi:phage terminase large subunit
MTEINLNRKLNWKHTELFQSTAPILAVRGGSNAGKTYSIVDKLLLQPLLQRDVPLRAVCVKRTMPSLKKTILYILEKRAEEVFALPLDVNTTLGRAKFLNLTIDFLSLNNKEDYIKAKSMTDIDFIWVNEITELREYDFDILNMRIRGGKSSSPQFIFDFNPVGKTSWVFKRFYETNNNGNGNIHKLLYTVLDNPWAKPEEIEKLKAYKDHNENLYNIFFRGEWGELEGIIFNWDIVDRAPDNPDEVFYGGDFGYSVNEAALVRIYRKADEFWLEEIIYETSLTNQQLAKKTLNLGVKRMDDTYWDSAEPKSIQELCDAGLNAKPSEKGPDSVRAGIDFLLTKKIHIIDGSENIIREQKSYTRRKDKDGRFLPEPIKINDHAMSAVRYGICTHCMNPEARPRIWSLGS